MDDPTKQLVERFTRLNGDWNAVANLFVDEFRRGFISRLVSRELGAITRDRRHTITSGVNQYTLTPINLPELEYTTRIMTPFQSRPHIVKWLGMRQIIGMKGKGSVRIRKLRAPASCSIEQFQAGIELEHVDDVMLTNLQHVATGDGRDLLDLDSVTEPSILEILTLKADASPVIWTFGQDLKSTYAEQSSPLVSRFRNVVKLAVAMGRRMPDDIYEKALSSTNTRLALAAMEGMFAERRSDAFATLHEAIESENDALRNGAETLLALVANPAGGADAA
ncbi:hypothetical protein [Collimonas pratensis]|uniref:Uncharacterized protein n=1 Tax=Collimonas pratensis TaxID=279113 RepID=A0ABN4M712_9BURK|nr:hypothetical protein [Collimonas pratensis]AMP13360.1 hypothetical protein CPter291_1083 [Collimonas pratensis]NKI68065.1 hypothetical protein [Collimonas pratensis]